MANALTKIDGSEWPVKLGPAMLDLPSDQWRVFAFAIVEAGGAYGAGAKAARAAGFGHEGTSAESYASIAYRLMHDPRMIAAIGELAAAQTRALAPQALATVKQIMSTFGHKDQLKAAGMVLARTDPEIQKSEVKVELVDPEQQAVALLKHMLGLGAPEDVLLAEFGPTGLARYRAKLAQDAKPIIDAEFTEVPQDEWSAL